MPIQSQGDFGAAGWKPRKKRVLIVEDNHLDSALFSALLESQGHEVMKAGNADDGLKIAREDTPDLIIMDVKLPGMSGFEATKILKAEMPRETSRSSSPRRSVPTRTSEKFASAVATPTCRRRSRSAALSIWSTPF